MQQGGAVDAATTDKAVLRDALMSDLRTINGSVGYLSEEKKDPAIADARTGRGEVICTVACRSSDERANVVEPSAFPACRRSGKPRRQAGNPRYFLRRRRRPMSMPSPLRSAVAVPVLTRIFTRFSFRSVRVRAAGAMRLSRISMLE